MKKTTSEIVTQKTHEVNRDKGRLAALGIGELRVLYFSEVQVAVGEVDVSALMLVVCASSVCICVFFFCFQSVRLS